MFERARDISRALTAPSSNDQDAVHDAVGWFARLIGSTGTPLLVLPTRRLVTADPTLQQLAGAISTETAKTFGNSRWRGGPVLLAWPDQAQLTAVDNDRRVTALCVIAWQPDDVASWAAAHDPERLGRAAETSPPGRPHLDPVVEVALEHLTGRVNHSNHLTGIYDKRDAVETLTRLYDAGLPLSADDVYAWSLAHGWPAPGSERLREMTEKVSTGRRLRAGAPWALRDDIVEVWRAQAAKRP